MEANDILDTAAIGIGATLVIDLWNLLLNLTLRVPLPNYALLGRWFLHMPNGIFTHANIASSQHKAFEHLSGWIAHYIVGVLLASIFVFIAPNNWLTHPNLLPALVYGIGTVAIPYLIMQPAFGFGIAASKTPDPAMARIKSLATHTVFGVGLYLCALCISSIR